MATVFAGQDVTTERGGPTALDGRHRLELTEADVTGIGPPPSRPMGAEDVRDLQSMAGHGAAVQAGGLAFFLFFARAGLESCSSGLSTLAIMPVATRV